MVTWLAFSRTAIMAVRTTAHYAGVIHCATTEATSVLVTGFT